MAATAKTTSRMSAPERRQQLLDVTKAIVAGRGFHAVSIDAVAREAGITRPVVYDHFGDLDALLDALVVRETERSVGQLDAVIDYDLTADDPVEVLLRSLRAYLEVVRDDPDTWRLVLMPPEGAPDSLHARIATGREQVLARLAQNAEPGFGAGSETPDPELTARMMSAVSDEGARLLLTEPERYSVDRILDHTEWVLRLIERGAAR